jgi:hypothetical protein
MMGHPTLYQINTRTWLTSLSRLIGRPASLDDIPDADLDQIASQGFDWVYLLGVWQTGTAGRQVSLSNPEWRKEYQAALPDVRDDDICGSCFAITSYTIAKRLGGEAALQHLRSRLQARGLRLMLDFVPNHTAPDHPWVHKHPEFYIQGSQDNLQSDPENYASIETARGRLIIAKGRDPYFPGWPDTLQLNYASTALQAELTGELVRIASICDGLRCDMAMLVLPRIFKRTWGIDIPHFWPRAIQTVRQSQPDFVFMAEVYWDLEAELLGQGFDYAYDKRLYDRLHAQDAGRVREHLVAELSYQNHMARFLENHDEPRAAAVFPWQVHQAAGIITYLSPGLHFFHQGQLQGNTRKVPIHLCRGPQEPVDPDVTDYYTRLLACLQLPATQFGEWKLLSADRAWPGNESWQNFIGFYWQSEQNASVLIVVNYGHYQAQCYLPLPADEAAGKQVYLLDQMHPIRYERSGDHLVSPGLYLDMPAWGYHVFVLQHG